MLRGILFDFDGVIVDTETAWYRLYRDWLKSDYGYDLKLRDYLVCVGADSDALFDFLDREMGRPVDRENFLQSAGEEFRRRTAELPPMEGAERFIRDAKTRGLKLALATSAKMAKPAYHLKRLGLYDAFDAFATAENCGRVKPEPDLFLKAASLLGLEPGECLAVEDSANGLLAARRAGTPCLVIPNRITRDSDFTGCYRRADSLAEVGVGELIKDFEAAGRGSK